jgi:hypothetical protein
MGQVGRRAETTMSRTVTRYFAVVRRGETELFRTLLHALTDNPGPVQVIWDRRSRERRQRGGPGSLDRRRSERRGYPPATWLTLGFVFAPYRSGATAG